MKQAVLLLFLIALIPFAGKAQNEFSPKNTVSYVVTQPLFKGSRVEYERKMNQWLWANIAPMHFLSTEPYGNTEGFWGAGVGFGAKIFTDKELKHEGLFLMATVDYNYFDFKRMGTYLEEDQWNGFLAYVPKTALLHQKVNRLKGMLFFGVQGVSWHFQTSVRMGIGYQHSIIAAEKGVDPVQDLTMLNLAYTGYTYNISICVGGIF